MIRADHIRALARELGAADVSFAGRWVEVRWWHSAKLSRWHGEPEAMRALISMAGRRHEALGKALRGARMHGRTPGRVPA